MENRYLYKAKTTKKDESKHAFNNVWVEGDLIISTGKYYIHPRANAVSMEGELGKRIIMHEVYPATICQCAGHDGIWENDIFEYDGNRYWIEYDETDMTWCATWTDDCMKLMEVPLEDITIIGNTFDDPELLKESEKAENEGFSE